MRALMRVSGLFAVAVGLVIAARYNNGYVLLVLPPWRAELSLNLAIMLALSAFFISSPRAARCLACCWMNSRQCWPRFRARVLRRFAMNGSGATRTRISASA